MDDLSKYLASASEYILAALPNIILAGLLIIAGLWVIKKLIFVMSSTLEKSGIGVEINAFLCSLASIGLKVFLFIYAADLVGINTAAFLGVLAAAGLAIGLALQGSLSNFAAGIVIILFKPYKVGDWVEVKEKFGKVQEIQIFNTIIISPGNKTLIIPNAEVISGVVTNFSKIGNIRLDMKINLPYAEDFPNVRKLILDGLASTEGVLDEPVPEVGIDSFGDHNIIISVRPYVHPDQYWDVYYSVMSRIKTIYHENKISIGYPEGYQSGSVGK